MNSVLLMFTPKKTSFSFIDTPSSHASSVGRMSVSPARNSSNERDTLAYYRGLLFMDLCSLLIHTSALTVKEVNHLRSVLLREGIYTRVATAADLSLDIPIQDESMLKRTLRIESAEQMRQLTCKMHGGGKLQPF